MQEAEPDVVQQALQDPRCPAKKRTATKPITTHETAVGRKKTERKNRQPRTCVLIRNATPKRQHDRDRDRQDHQRVVLEHLA